MSSTLVEIANKYNSDKGTLAFEAHNYAAHYDEWFTEVRDRPITILEIGVKDIRFPGASLDMWKEYFSQAKLIGFDIVDCREFDDDRVTTFIGDQGNAFDLVECASKHGPFDIVIDDGSHLTQNQITSFYTLFPLHVKPNGIYVIEDLHVAPHSFRYFEALFSAKLHGGTAFYEILIPGRLLLFKRNGMGG